ncbi:unnamed protein product [Symbiodinium natans]|uniref:Uncharacterized protein n=1 Tax=Symbiodinium natans TaxID=878477 RepID=A0A812I428_9DINO|nr:unnamed protein product [Symbiodinium natans]
MASDRQVLRAAQNKVSGDWLEINFHLPGTIWQLKCKIASTLPDRSLDNADTGVILWKVLVGRPEEEIEEIQDLQEEITLGHRYLFVLRLREKLDVWLDMKQCSLSRRGYEGNAPDYEFSYVVHHEDLPVLQTFDDFADAVFKQMETEGYYLRHTEDETNCLVRFNLDRCEFEPKRALVSFSGRDQVQEIVVYCDGESFWL